MADTEGCEHHLFDVAIACQRLQNTEPVHQPLDSWQARNL